MPPTDPNHPRPPRRIAGYGSSGRIRPAQGQKPPRPKPSVVVQFAAWLAATLVAGALLLLLAQHDPLLVLPIVMIYFAFSWVAWHVGRR